jgi:hypothetical protein
VSFTYTYPKLAHDAMMAREFGSKLNTRMHTERQVVWDLCAHLAKAGFEPYRLDDGEVLTKVADAKAAMELLFNLDEGRLYFSRKGGGVRECVFFVFGNDGWDCAADMSCGRPDWDAAIESFDFERYE